MIYKDSIPAKFVHISGNHVNFTCDGDGACSLWRNVHGHHSRNNGRHKDEVGVWNEEVVHVLHSHDHRSTFLPELAGRISSAHLTLVSEKPIEW